VYATLPGGRELLRWSRATATVCSHCPGLTAEFYAELEDADIDVSLHAEFDGWHGTFAYAREPKTYLGQTWQLKRGYVARDRGVERPPVFAVERGPWSHWTYGVKRGAVSLDAWEETLEARFWLDFPIGAVRGYVVGRPDHSAGWSRRSQNDLSHRKR
jgi:hypothetical protein